MKTLIKNQASVVGAPVFDNVELITLSKQVTANRCINKHKRKQNE